MENTNAIGKIQAKSKASFSSKQSFSFQKPRQKKDEKEESKALSFKELLLEKERLLSCREEQMKYKKSKKDKLRKEILFGLYLK